MNEPREIKYVPRGMIILLDESEQGAGALTSALFVALAEKAGPLLVSATLLSNVFSIYDQARNNQYSFSELVKLADTDQNIRRIAYFIATKFDKNEWIFKKVSEYLYLLLPKSLWSTHGGIPHEQLVRYDPRNISRAELRLGLKVNHFKTIPFEDILKLSVARQNDTNYFIDALVPKAKQEFSLFCTRLDYRNRGATEIPLWSFFINGHGQIPISGKGNILSISYEIFKKVLDFFDINISTQLVAYLSCFAAEEVTEKIFYDMTSLLQRTYSYAIMSGALVESPTKSNTRLEAVDDISLNLSSTINFSAFLALIQSTQGINYAQVAQALFSKNVTEGIYWTNTPLIKLPGLEWFTLVENIRDVSKELPPKEAAKQAAALEATKEIVSIGSILAQTRGNRPLDVVHFFRTDPKAILLYAPSLPFELVLNSQNLQAIISMIPGDALHSIKKISSKTKSADELLDAFMKIEELAPKKIFFIEQLNDLKNIIIYNENVPIRLELAPGIVAEIAPGTQHCYALYEIKNVLYKKMLKQPAARESDSVTIKLYRALLKDAQAAINLKTGSPLSKQDFEHMETLIRRAFEKKKTQRADLEGPLAHLAQTLQNLSKALQKIEY